MDINKNKLNDKRIGQVNGGSFITGKFVHDDKNDIQAERALQDDCISIENYINGGNTEEAKKAIEKLKDDAESFYLTGKITSYTKSTFDNYAKTYEIICL